MIDLLNCPNILKDYLFYLQTIKGRSERTVEAYYIDLRNFFRFICIQKKLVDNKTPYNEINISIVNIDIIKKITLSDVYVSSEKQNNATTRSRKVSSLRSYFNYLTLKVHLLDENPIRELEVPNVQKRLPKYLTLEQCLELLKNIDGNNKQRDYCIITLFLNCGMRLSELVNINISDIVEDKLKVIGKGNKERIVYLNQACIDSVADYLKERKKINGLDKNALFISRNNKRISKRRIQEIVEENLQRSGLSNMGFSTHKLRHTAATMMYQHGNVDIRVLQEILGHANLGTTQIYTHINNQQMKNAINSSPLANIKAKKGEK
ncbi:MAG: tyrosine recombinase XerC [Oscillospiraceae bacterium]